MINSVIRFFDLYDQYRATDSRAQTATNDELAPWRQFIVWLFAALGVVLGPYALDAAAGTFTPLSAVFGSGLQLFWAAIFGAVLVAVAFRVKFLTPKTPLIGQIGMAILIGFASGKLIPMVIAWIVKIWPAHAGTF